MPRNENKRKRAPAGLCVPRKKTVKKNGTEYTYYEARCTTGYDPETGKQIQKSITGKTEREVVEKYKAMQREVDRGTYTEPSKMTLKEFLEIWQRDYLVGVSPNTANAYKTDCRVHIIPALGAVKLSKLTPMMIQRFYNGLKNRHTGEPLSAKTVHDIHGTLHRALNKAVALELIARNPADVSAGRIELPKVRETERKPMDDKQLMDFIDAIQNHKFRLIYLVTVFTGMREGEVLGLPWDSIDWDAGVIYIKQQLLRDRDKKIYVLDLPKRRKKRRIVVAKEVLDWLREQQESQKKAREAAGSAWNNPWNLVFTDALGHHLYPVTVYENFKRIVKSLGCDEQRVHDLRHAFATNSLANGDDPETVRENMGHYSIKMLDRYGHRKTAAAAAGAARMGSYIRTVMPHDPGKA